MSIKKNLLSAKSLLKSLTKSLEKESKNMGAKNVKWHFVETGLSLLGKNILKKLWVQDNSNKYRNKIYYESNL